MPCRKSLTGDAILAGDDARVRRGTPSCRSQPPAQDRGRRVPWASDPGNRVVHACRDREVPGLADRTKTSRPAVPGAVGGVVRRSPANRARHISPASLPGRRRRRPDYWLASAMFTVSLVQKKMQGQKKNKGHTVVVMDDNKRHMPALSNAIYQANPWFDGLYQVRKTKRGKRFWEPRNVTNRFDQIINSPFAIKSNHSSFVQIADAIAYVYRRHFELMAIEESWSGERQYVAELAQVLEAGRETIILDRKVRQLREHPFEARSLLRSPSEPGDQSSWASSSSMGSSPGQAPQSTMGST